MGATQPASTGPSAAAATSAGQDDFDAFDDPDFTFQTSVEPVNTSGTGRGAAGNDDDDAFADFDSSFAPAKTLPAPAEDDSDAVKQVLAMGFSRNQAVEALEKSDVSLG
jgi:hypothetical protein